MNKYKTGLEVFLEEKVNLVENKRIGLVTNHTGLTTDLKNNVDLFYNHPEIKLVKLFGPEHGVRGNARAGDKVTDTIDKKTGLPVISLYGDNKKPDSEVLEDIDILIFDIQDIGVRFYTYVSTLFYTLESCGENDVQMIVLDRMNPLGRKVEGNIITDDFSSFVGLYPLPHRHGMTFGELARWANQEFSLNTNLKIIKTDGWHGEYFDEFDNFWVPPSPGIPHFKTALVYPITCMLEGTNISEGRGTANPFEFFGAPWIDPDKLTKELEKKDLPGLRFRPTYFIPSFSKHKGKECGGVQVLINNRDKIDSYLSSLTIISTLFDLYPHKTEWKKLKNHKYFFDLLMGTDDVRKKLDKDMAPKKIKESWNEELDKFKKVRKKYLLY